MPLSASKAIPSDISGSPPSIGMSNMSKQEKAQYCRWSCESGFMFMDEILKAMDTMDVTEYNLGELIRQIIESVRSKI